MVFVLMDQLCNFTLCKEFLKKLKELAETANKAILHLASNMHETESQTNHSNETSAVPTYL